MYSKDDLQKYGTWKEYEQQFGCSGMPAIFEIVDDEICLSPTQIAELLFVSPETIRRWVRSSKLRTLSSHGRYIIQGQDLKEYLFQRYRKKKF